MVKKNIRKEVREETQREEHQIIHTTIEEEKMRHARRLNIRVTGIVETPNSTPEKDGQLLCMKLGYREEDPLPFTKAWRAGKDNTQASPHPTVCRRDGEGHLHEEEGHTTRPGGSSHFPG